MQAVDKYYGVTEVFDEREQKNVTLTISKSKKNEKGYRVLTAEIDGTVVGKAKYAKVADFLYKGRLYGYESLNGELDEQYYGSHLNGDLEEYVPKIYLHDLQSPQNQRLHGVGTKLLQALFEISLLDKHKSNGRIEVIAEKDSHPFYYKAAHMRAMTGRQIEGKSCDARQVDAKLLERIKSAEAAGKRGPDGQHWDNLKMYLPKAAAATLTQKVRNSPILEKTKKARLMVP